MPYGLRSRQRRSLRAGLRLWILGSCAAGGLGLWLVAGTAYAQQSCDPPTTPCQTCPPPPPCAPSNTACGSGNTTSTTSSQSCIGSTDQLTITVTEAIGPAFICVGPDRSVGCFVPAGGNNFNVHTDSIVAGGAVGIPMLSPWALGALAAALGILALWRLSSVG